MIEKISYRDAVNFLINKHYSGRIPSISYAYGWYEFGILVAVVTYGKPASPPLCRGVCGELYSENVIELNRLCTDGNMKDPLSKFLSKSLRSLKSEGNFIVVSYADTGMNHRGYIYQATNFLYTGCSKTRTDRYSGKGKHPRHYDKDAVQKYRVVRSGKHRYIIFIGTKSFKRKAYESLNYTEEPYPKGDNGKYQLGYVLEQVLVEV